MENLEKRRFVTKKEIFLMTGREETGHHPSKDATSEYDLLRVEGKEC